MGNRSRQGERREERRQKTEERERLLSPLDKSGHQESPACYILIWQLQPLLHQCCKTNKTPIPKESQEKALNESNLGHLHTSTLKEHTFSM
jgi:hypothetical protein